MARKPQVAVEIVDEDGTQYGTGGLLKVQGPVAQHSTVAGNPQMMGFRVTDAVGDGGGGSAGKIKDILGDNDGGILTILKHFAASRAADVVYLADATALGTGTNAALKVLAAQFGYNGATLDMIRTPTTFKMIDAVSVTAGSGATVWTPASGKKFRLMGWSLSVASAAAIEFHDHTVGTIVLQTPLLAAGGIHNSRGELGNGFISASANNVLKLDVTANAAVSGMVWGVEE